MVWLDSALLLRSVCLIAGVIAGGGVAPSSPAPPGDGYADLLAFYRDFRAFQKPKTAGSVPDYTPAAIAAQQEGLEAYRKPPPRSTRATGPSHGRSTTTSSGRR